MPKRTAQMEVWSGEFGKAYTDRNLLSPDELDALYISRLGVSRRAMNAEFIGSLDRNLRVLEVGSNVGNQLAVLQDMGFHRLYGVELQLYAVELAKQRSRGINIIEGSAFEVPFRDGFFDLVFTSGVLIHVAPADVAQAVDEIHRCSRRFIWGMEYFARDQQEISYRGNTGLLWKSDFAAMYVTRHSDLRLVKQVTYPALSGDTEDAMFLLERQG